jgi:hypothetical protein
MWNVKAKVILVITGATGTMPKSFRKHLSNIPGNHDVRELQKTLHCTHTSESDDVKTQKSRRRN